MTCQFPPAGLFVTGTDTEVGKTYVASLLARALVADGHRVGVYKPAASGGRSVDGRCSCDDAVQLWQAAGRPATIYDVCPQMFLAPVAPHVAARLEGREINADLLVTGLQFWADRCDFVIVEGAGGWMSPLSDRVDVADVARDMGYPVLVVTANRLGTINQTLQTLLAVDAYLDSSKVAGLVLNDVSPDEKADASRASNADELRRRVPVEVLAHIAWQQTEWPAGQDWTELVAQCTRR